MRIAWWATCAIRLRLRRRWRVAMLCFMLRPTTGCGCAIPREMYRSNVEGTRSLLEAARKQGVRRVVYTSSVATMGFTSGHDGRRGSLFGGLPY